MADVDRRRLVIFDLDGTLVDSQSGIIASFRATLADIGASATDAELRDLIGPPLGESFARLGVAQGHIDDVVANYRTYYDQFGVEQCRLYDGVVDVLTALRDREFTLAVATSKRIDFARRMLVNLGVVDFFDSIGGATVDGRLKTKREILNWTLESLEPRSMPGRWMVGDRREDMLAARQCSLSAIGVLWGYGKREELVESGAQLLVESPFELLVELSR